MSHYFMYDNPSWAQFLVNAHAPIKDIHSVFSGFSQSRPQSLSSIYAIEERLWDPDCRFSVFVWTAENDSNTYSPCGRGCFFYNGEDNLRFQIRTDTEYKLSYEVCRKRK